MGRKKIQITKSSVYFGHGISEPIGLEYIAGYLQQIGYTPLFLSHNELEINLTAQDITLSLFSATSPEWNLVLELNKEAKARGNITLIGGYHITGVYREEEHIPFDYAIIGEGDQYIQKVIEDIKSNKGFSPVQCKVFIAPQIKNINALPFPWRNEAFLKNYKLCDLHWPAPSKQINTALILGSRGCNNSCSFCASSTMWGCGIRKRDPDNIIAEIKELQNNFGTNNLVFVDQAMGQDTQWTRELCHKMIEAKLNINWYIQTNITIDPTLIPIMAEAGCSKIGFGIECISPSVVRQVKPVHRNHMNNINELFSHCNQHGILTKAYFILGFPWETKKIINEYMDDIKDFKVNVIKISFYTPFPGTSVYEKYKNQLITDNWDYFDLVSKPVIHNPNITPLEYINIRAKLFNKFYDSQEFKDTTYKLIEDYPEFKESYYEFFEFLKSQDMINNNTKFKTWLPEFDYNQQVVNI